MRPEERSEKMERRVEVSSDLPACLSIFVRTLRDKMAPNITTLTLP